MISDRDFNLQNEAGWERDWQNHNETPRDEEYTPPPTGNPTRNKQLLEALEFLRKQRKENGQ